MKEKEFIESLKGKTVDDLLELLKSGQTGNSKIAQDNLSAIIYELNSRELSEAELNLFEKIMNNSIDDTSTSKLENKFSKETRNGRLIDKENEYGRYSALKTISGLISILGYTIIIIGFAVMLYLLNENQTFYGIGILIASIIISLPLLAFSNLISVFIDIEQNTRKTRELINNSK